MHVERVCKHIPGQAEQLAKVDQGRSGDRRCIERSQKVGRGERHSGCLDMHTEAGRRSCYKEGEHK
jgi:hypothetical protein